MSDSKAINIIGHVNPTAAGYELTLESQYGKALTGLEGFSHAVVLWWASETDSAKHRDQLIYKKPYTNNPNDIGVFGSRSPSRPNPIGMSVIALQRVDVNTATITTPYIDTEPGTPIVDIKPYYPASDCVRDFTVPDWCQHWPKCYEESAEFDWAGEFN